MILHKSLRKRSRLWGSHCCSYTSSSLRNLNRYKVKNISRSVIRKSYIDSKYHYSVSRSFGIINSLYRGRDSSILRSYTRYIIQGGHVRSNKSK